MADVIDRRLRVTQEVARLFEPHTLDFLYDGPADGFPEMALQEARRTARGLDDIGRIFGGLDTVNWTVSGDSPVLDEGADELTWTFYYNRVLAGGESAGLFQNIVIPECLDSGDMAALSGFRIRIRAEAVQSDYTADSAPGAFGLLE